MAKVMSSGKGHPQLPPTDRELALRAQIKTGWSSYRKSSSLSQRQNLSEQEVKIIQDVVERAQALERMEEIRIGLLMLKHKQMVDNCRGDGVTSCRICNRDFTSQRSSRPEPIQYCQDCQMVMCGRCKNVCKMVGGQDRLLCTVCYDERELWKKSGAWLDHSVPSVSIPEEELEELQQQQVKTTKVTIGRKRESTLVIDPYQCAEESDDDEDDNDPLNSSTASKSGIQFSRSSEPSPITNRRASPIPEFTAPKAKQLEAAFSAGHKSSSDSEDQRNFSANLKTRSFSRKANLSRKGGITGTNRDRLLKYRERARSNSPHSRSTSPSSNTEMGVADRDVPSIKVSAIPSRSLASSQANRNSTPDSENDSPQKRHIRQMQSAPYTESGSIQVSTRGEPFTVNKDNPPAANRSPIAGRSPSPQPGRTKPETSGETKALIEELKKVKSPPQKPPPLNESKPAHDEFKKVKMSGSLPRNSLPTLKNEDEFRKVKSIAPPPQNPPPVNESKPAHDEFKKVKTASLPRHSLPMDKKSEDEFKKVKSTAPAPQKPPPVMDASAKPSEDEFKKVKSGPSPSKPPPVLDASKVVDEDFKKVKSSSLERTRKSPEKVPRTRTLPRDGGLGAVKEGENVGGEFKKVNPRSSPFKAGGSDEKPVPQPAHSSPPRVAAKLGSGKPTGEEEMFKKVSLPNNEPKPFLPNKRKVLPDLPSSGPPPVVPRGAVPPTAPPRETPTVPTSTPPPHVPRQMKPLPPSGGPPPPLPEKPSSSSSNTISAGSKLGGDFPMLVDAGKQSSITSVGSSVMSEHSATYDVDSGMASPSSLGSTDSVDTGKQAFSFDKQRPAKETSSSEAAAGATGADDIHSRSLDRSSLSRRNAGRLNKRPPPRPRLDEEEAEGRSSSSQSQEQGSEMGPVVTRPRARSRVIRKRPQGMAGGTEDSNAPSDSSHATLEEGSTQAEFPQRRTRTRSSAVTSADRFQARTASSRTESGEHGNVRPDGEKL